MNLQERQALELFLQQLTQVQANQKDAEADALIREACARQPDAGYLLVQRAMQLEQALLATQARCSQLQADLDKARAATQTSFLNDANAWGRSPTEPVSPSAPVAASSGSPVQPRVQAPAPAAAPAPSWGSGMLGNIATTAAGVVAGSFLFHGIENLMGHHTQGHSGAANADPHAVASVAEDTTVTRDDDNSGADDPFEVADAGGDPGGDELA